MRKEYGYINRRDRLLQQHGEGVARTYGCWTEIRRRLKNPVGNNSCYAGISIDPRWDKFDIFLQDMGEAPIGKSIDRIENSKGYWPDNCRWSDATVQSRNRSYVKMNIEKANIIRDRYRSGNISQQKLANEHSVSQVLISKIILNRLWT